MYSPNGYHVLQIKLRSLNSIQWFRGLEDDIIKRTPLLMTPSRHHIPLNKDSRMLFFLSRRLVDGGLTGVCLLKLKKKKLKRV